MEVKKKLERSQRRPSNALFFGLFVSQKPKSITAAEATRDINPDLQVEAHLNKVCPATESIYSDSFYSRLNVVVTALDNVEARRYVDRFVPI